MFRKLSFLWCCAAMIFAASLTADESAREHSPVGTRAESIEKRMASLETRSKMAAIYKDGKALKAAKGLGFLKPNISYTLHPASYQSAASISYSLELNSTMIELTDGSIWFANPYELNDIDFWDPTHPVIITKNHAWGSPYAFRLTNQWSGQSVAIDIHLGPIAPIYACYYTHWIKEIDYYNNTIKLEDNSIWYMSMFDAATVNQWIPGDIVIIGVNDGWLFAYNPNMLINVATLDFAVGAHTYK
jgi:hypothetical protein